MKRAFALLVPVVLTIAVCVLAETRANFHAPRLMQLAALSVLAIYLVTRVRGRVRDTAVGVVSLLVALTVVEGVCVALEPATPSQDSGDLDAAKPIVGYGASHPGRFSFVKTLPGGRTVCRVHVTIDQNGLRATRGPEGPHPVAFFGDSFTFGDCLDDADTLPEQFAQVREGTQPVLNVGFSGWSPAQNLAVLQAGLYRPLLDHAKRFVLVTAPWHIERTSCKAAFARMAPRYVLDDGTLRLAGDCRRSLRDAVTGVLGRFAAYRRLVAPLLMQPSRPDVDTFLAIVDTFVKVAQRDYGVPVTIFYLPGEGYLKSSGITAGQFEDALSKTGADLLVDHLPAIADPSRYVIAGDGHPTALANAARARELADHLDALAQPAGAKASLAP